MDKTAAIEMAITSWSEFCKPRPAAEVFAPWTFTLFDQMPTHDGVAWIGEMTHAERPGAVRVEQAGRGGSNYYYTDETEDSKALLKYLFEQAEEFVGSTFEPVDTFVSIVDEADYYFERDLDAHF